MIEPSCKNNQIFPMNNYTKCDNYNISSSAEKVGNTDMVFPLKRKSQTNSQRKNSHNPGTSKAQPFLKPDNYLSKQGLRSLDNLFASNNLKICILARNCSLLLRVSRVCPFLQKQGDRGSQKFFDDCGVESCDSLIDSHPCYGVPASGCQRSFRPT